MLVAGIPGERKHMHIYSDSCVPVVIGAAMQTTLSWGYFQLDGIGLPTYAAILLYQILRGWDGLAALWRRFQSKHDHRHTI